MNEIKSKLTFFNLICVIFSKNQRTITVKNKQNKVRRLFKIRKIHSANSKFKKIVLRATAYKVLYI